jgi:hypothetical protein
MTDETVENGMGTDALQSLGKKFSGFFSSLKDKHASSGSSTIIMTRKQALTSIVVCAISIIIALVYGYMTYQKHLTINAQAPTLANLSTYGISLHEEILRPYASSISSIADMLKAGEEVATTLEQRIKLSEDQGKYYNMLLRYIYLPSLNIRKDPYTQAIDPTIMGQKYLEADPFQDIPLIQYWSDFFKNVGE